LLWLVLKLANQLGVDADQGFSSTLEEYRRRFPVDKVKGITANKELGYDGKDEAIDCS